MIQKIQKQFREARKHFRNPKTTQKLILKSRSTIDLCSPFPSHLSPPDRLQKQQFPSNFELLISYHSFQTKEKRNYFTFMTSFNWFQFFSFIIIFTHFFSIFFMNEFVAKLETRYWIHKARLFVFDGKKWVVFLYFFLGVSRNFDFFREKFPGKSWKIYFGKIGKLTVFLDTPEPINVSYSFMWYFPFG
jgi:hypothetical protein